VAAVRPDAGALTERPDGGGFDLDDLTSGASKQAEEVGGISGRVVVAVGFITAQVVISLNVYLIQS
jgi:hypothetical protein